MPAFFALSGYLFKKKNNFKDYLSMIIKKAINLLIPYVVFSIIYVCIQHFGNDINHQYTFSPLLNIWYQPISYLWFLYILFLIFLLVGGLSLLNFNYYIQLSLFIVLFLVINYYKLSIYALQTFGYALFFLCGVICKKHIKYIRKHKILLLLVSTLLSLLAFAVCLYISGFKADFDAVTIVNFILKIIVSFFAIILCINWNEKGRVFQYYEKYGKNSLIIYLIHAPVISAVCAVLAKFIYRPNIISSILFLYLNGWYVSLFVIQLNKRLWLVRMIFSPYKTWNETRYHEL